MPFRIEPTDIILIVLAAMILFGASRLPEIGRGFGKAITEFRRGIRENPDQTSSDRLGTSRLPSGNYCTQCGAANADDARYCGQCGQLIIPLGGTHGP
jgi:sec-independent protein translocase protein TatA